MPHIPVVLPNAAIFSNLAAFDPAFAYHHHYVVYPARTATANAIALAAFPPGSLVLAREGYPTLVGDALVDEQLAPWLREQPDRLAALLAEARPEVEIDVECVLLARYGEGTWGHWLGELLPRAVVAEHFYPGRFHYAVPEWTTRPDEPGLPASVLGSLRAYGIPQDRLVRLAADSNYRFRALATVTSVRSDNVMHPGVLDLMRANARCDPAAFGADRPARVALFRQDVGRRGIANAEEIAPILAAAGFTHLEMGNLSFDAQVAVFRAASSVFCVLGSGLTGLIYAPDGVNVIAPAPENWGDSFFYPLVQLRAGTFADIRGPIEREDPVNRRDSTFRVPVGALREVLEMLGLAEKDPPPTP